MENKLKRLLRIGIVALLVLVVSVTASFAPPVTISSSGGFLSVSTNVVMAAQPYSQSSEQVKSQTIQTKPQQLTETKELMAIVIGHGATNRGSTANATLTIIDLANPANAAGWITSIEIWAATDLTGVVVGSFTNTSGTNFTCRDAVVIGAVTSGSKQTFTSLYLWVEAGDYLGIYWGVGTLERDTDGGSGIYYLAGNQASPQIAGSYTLITTDAISIYATGTEASIERFGSDPINRTGLTANTYTTVSKDATAVNSGTIVKTRVFVNTAGTIEFATFSASGDNLTTRDTYTSEALGTGYQHVYPDLTVSAGDYVGLYSVAGRIDRVDSGAGYWANLADYIPCVNQAMTPYADRTISMDCLVEYELYTIENLPTTESLGLLDINSTTWAFGSTPDDPVDAAHCTFTVTNAGIACDLDMKITDFLGDGVDWNIVAANPGADEVVVTVYREGDHIGVDGTVLANGDTEFYDSLAVAPAHVHWDFSILTGTFSNGNAKSATITITARLHT